MGKHFDTLVDLVKNTIGPREEFDCGYEKLRAKEYLSHITRRAKLFEFPFNVEEIFPRAGKGELNEYIAYLSDYFDISKQFGRFFITPFPLVAIEDPNSVVIMDNINLNRFRVIMAAEGFEESDEPHEKKGVIIGHTAFLPPNDNQLVPISADAKYYAATKYGIRQLDVLNYLGLGKARSYDLGRGVLAWIEQVIYIIDPENFIIRKESNASLKQRERGKRRDLLLKTVMRPHYLCLNLEETRQFLVNESKTPFPAHPVVGHWRRLMSERYTKMRGQVIHIAQYFTGEGKVIARGGWNYQVMLKYDPITIRPYKGSK